MARATLVLTCLLALPCAAQAHGIYRWVDERGSVHFSETPPPKGAGAEKWTGSGRDPISVVPQEAGAPVYKRAPSASPAAPEQHERVGGRYEWEWRKEGQASQGRIDSLEEQLEREQDRSFTGYRSSLSAARAEARSKARIEELERKIVAAETALEELEDRAREQGVPPGWLR